MKKTLLRITLAAATAAIAAAATPAVAQESQGKWQVKLLATGVLPDGEIGKVNLDLVGLPGNTQTRANDNYVPTTAIEYFFTPSVSLETICCLTQHDVDGTTGLPGAELVSDAKLVPATFTLKYHLNPGGISPYVGAGPAYFLWLDAEPGAAAIAAGADDFNMTDELGLALQAGIDIPVGEGGMAVSLDAKRYFVGTTARWYAGGAKVIETEHNLDPWVLSAGVAFRF
ncbi:MAG: OmpW/AlkL family protein [Croceibacterium sp.]